MSVAEALFIYFKARDRRDQYVYLQHHIPPSSERVERLNQAVEAANGAVDVEIRKLLQGVLDEQRGM